MIEVLKAGMFSTIQDLGRFGYRNYGVPVSGVMDAISAGLANALLNNNKNDAVLEITMSGPTLHFLTKTFIAITGAAMQPKINKKTVFNNKVLAVNAGDIIEFGNLKYGLRCYLAVSGGFQTQLCLESRSYYNNITLDSTIKTGDFLPYHTTNKITLQKGYLKTNPFLFNASAIEIMQGPEYNNFKSSAIKKILKENFAVTNYNNRMGYRIDSQLFTHNISIITSPVLPGTVQIMPNGNLIILMKDAQTTGGYPRIFQLTAQSISILAQKKTGDTFTFKLII